MGGFLVDGFGIFLILSSIKLLMALSFDLYHSTDFDVHRNWLSITNTLPIDKWYFENTSEWTLDYPPFFAYFEYLLSIPAAKIDPLLVQISRTPISTENVVLFQKITVIITDIAVLFGAALISKAMNLSYEKTIALFVLLLGNFGLLLVDHIHFQYNGLIIGISLMFLAALESGRLYLGAILFCVMLNLKHLFLYVAPFVGIYYLSISYPKSLFSVSAIKQSATQVAKLAFLVCTVFSISFYKFASKDQLTQLFSRLFPVSRGLTHSYWAGNIWALYNTADFVLSKLYKIEKPSSLTSGLVQVTDFNVLPNVTPLSCIILMMLSIVPMLISVWKRPESKKTEAYCICALASFIFGYHVHEKAILLSLLPLAVVAVRNPDDGLGKTFLILSSAGYSGLLPLIFTDFEQPMIILLFACSELFTLSLFEKQFKRCYLLEKLYIISALPVGCYVQVWSKVLHPELPFLSLIIQSCYSSVGVLYSFLVLNYSFFRKNHEKVE